MKYSIFHIDGGIGKNVVATNVVRNIKKTHPDRELIVVSPYPEVFLYNPNIYRVYKAGACQYFYDDYIHNRDTIVFKHEPYFSNDVITRKTSLAEAWCKSLQIPFDANTPELYVNNIERQNSQVLFSQINNNGKPVIVIQINGGVGVKQNQINFNWFRDLPPFYAQNLISKYSDKFHFVQIRGANQIALEGAQQIDLSLRELFLLLANCKGAVGIDSMLQHVMTAFNKPSLVFWIGNSPAVYGYSLHTNLIASVDLSGHIESYLEPYPLNTLGYQCPSSYKMIDLFDQNTISSEFEKLFISNSQ